MKQSTKDTLKGKLQEVKGTFKQKTGQVTDNPKLEFKGRIEKMSGKIRAKVGHVEKVFGK